MTGLASKLQLQSVVLPRNPTLFSLSICLPRLFQSFLFAQTRVLQSSLSADKTCLMLYLEVGSNQKPVSSSSHHKIHSICICHHRLCLSSNHNKQGVSAPSETNTFTCALYSHPLLNMQSLCSCIESCFLL